MSGPGMSDTDRSDAPGARRLSAPLVLALVCAPWALLVGRFWFITDDAFISFRYAKHFAQGLGLRFNPGDHVPVEGYSNFLWVLVAAAVERAGAEVTFWVPLFSALCGLALLVLLFRRLRASAGLAASAWGLLTLACLPPFAMWSTSGLETMPFALLVYLVFDRLVLRDPVNGPSARDAVVAGLLGIAVALIRVEGLAWVAVIVAVAAGGRWLAGGRRLKPYALCAAVALGGYALYFLWRWSYHEALVPNTMVAKSGLPPSYYVRGLQYVATHFLVFPGSLLLVVASFIGLRRGAALGLPVVAMAWAFPAYAVVTTGDFMAMSRLLVPGLAFQTILFAWTFDDLRQRTRSAGPVAALATLVVVLDVLPAWDLHVVPQPVRFAVHFRHGDPNKWNFANERTVEQLRDGHEACVKFSELKQWEFQDTNVARGRAIGAALARFADSRGIESPSMVRGGIGAFGYYSDIYVHDRYGLVTPWVARTEVDPNEPMRWPGHDRHTTIGEFMDEEPTFVYATLLIGEDQPLLPRKLVEMGYIIESSGLQAEYVPDFFRAEGELWEGTAPYIVLVRRVSGGRANVQRERALLDRRIGAFRDRGEIETL